MRRLPLILFIQLITFQIIGQSNISFHPPVKIPMYLSGNFGEIRSDHFHSGIDIKTRGTTGHHVFSIESGYVSRIKVQANGYGKSIYISHPNGYTSVYGHLDRYRDDISEYVKQKQYKRRSHMVDLYMKPDQFKLNKGEFIGYSGNSGSSSGPHLHFEVRTSSNQHPTNVLKYGFDIKDGQAPRFFNLVVYPTDEDGTVNGSHEKFVSKLVPDQGVYTIPYGTKLSAFGRLGFAVEVFDYLDGASNRCGVYTLQMFVDDELKYSHVMDEFSFSETRYVNAHIDYGERMLNGTKAHRLHRLPNDRMRIYEQMAQDGTVNIREKKSYKIRIIATDVAGNRSESEFLVTGDPDTRLLDRPAADGSAHMKYQVPNRFEQGNVMLEIPANALYQDL
ncbi:MAG: M23 family metallopeptidase, partial [Bacteroidales bacterium]|nr:M23 family metallopeptidase [Bacteroidales bacterium]